MNLLKETPNLVFFNITTSGVAWAASNTVRVGIDMNYCPWMHRLLRVGAYLPFQLGFKFEG